MPIVLKYLLCFHILGIYHQSTGIAIQTMNDMSSTLLTRLLEIIIKYRFHIKRRVTSSHRENTYSFLNNNQPLVFIYNFNVTALERLLVAFSLAYSHLHSWLQLKVELANRLSVYLNTPTLQSRFYLVATLLNIL